MGLINARDSANDLSMKLSPSISSHSSSLAGEIVICHMQFLAIAISGEDIATYLCIVKFALQHIVINFAVCHDKVANQQCATHSSLPCDDQSCNLLEFYTMFEILTCAVFCHYGIPVETICTSLTLVSSCVIGAHKTYTSDIITTSWNGWINVIVAETI